MTKELVVELRFAADNYSLFDKSIGRDAADTIERLENELLATTIRVDNDARMIESLTQEHDAAVAESLEQSRLLGRVDRLEREQIGLALDAARLVWAMNNMCQHNYTLFGVHVMNVGGTGDVHDCRSFIDNAMKGETK
jgi:hypothetical protein